MAAHGTEFRTPSWEDRARNFVGHELTENWQLAARGLHEAPDDFLGPIRYVRREIMKDTSYDELTDICDDRTDVGMVLGYPFAFVLRMRVVQIVCGISTLLMGAVALIEEKSQFNLGIGIPAGLSTVLAAANSIYCSRGFDGYQPSSRKDEKWAKMRFLGSNPKIASVNIVLWGLATGLIFTLFFNSIRSIYFEESSMTTSIIAGVEFFLSAVVVVAMLTILWVDLHHDPDWQEPSDIVHSNTGTGVSMVTLSQSIVT